MRCPQYGHTKHKRRASHSVLPAECAPMGKLVPDGFAYPSNGHGAVTGKPAQGLHGGLVGHGAKVRYATVKPMALYHGPQNRVRYREQRHVKVTLKLWHKSAIRDGELDPTLQGPVISKKRSTVQVEDSHS